jgi:signal transduction histidine kinase
MSKEEINKIFIPHYRASNNESIGHGVGLTIVKRLSDRFHWLLEINSFPGKGTRIEVSF